jgi:hypothetical protein
MYRCFGSRWMMRGPVSRAVDLRVAEMEAARASSPVSSRSLRVFWRACSSA